jgi:hypothetical protein
MLAKIMKKFECHFEDDYRRSEENCIEKEVKEENEQVGSKWNNVLEKELWSYCLTSSLVITNVSYLLFNLCL